MSAVAALALVAKMHGLITDKAQLEVIHKPAPLPTLQLELSETEWRRQFEKPVHREAIAAPGRNGHGRTT